MQFIAFLLIAAAIFGLCYLLDKGFTKLFRGKAQHKSGTAVRANKRYATIGLILALIGIVAICSGIAGQIALLVGGLIVLGMGVALIVYYVSFGIFYDEDTLLLSGIGKQSTVYRFEDIRGQKLYRIQGGTIVVELHMADGGVVSIQTGTMDGAYPFLDHGFYAWCRQKGIDPDSCEFHDAANSLWFPTVEDI